MSFLGSGVILLQGRNKLNGVSHRLPRRHTQIRPLRICLRMKALPNRCRLREADLQANQSHIAAAESSAIGPLYANMSGGILLAGDAALCSMLSLHLDDLS